MTTSPLSDAIAVDLKTYGMRFIGTTIVYAYLQSIGVINAHEPGCFLHRERDLCRIHKVARAESLREEPVLLVILLIEFLVALFDHGEDSGRLFALLRGERFEQFAESQPTFTTG